MTDDIKIDSTKDKLAVQDSKSFSSITNDDGESTIIHNKNNNRQHNHQKSLWTKIMGDVYTEDDDPHQFSSTRKNIIVFIVALSGLLGPTATFIYMPGVDSVMKDMQTSLTGINATVAVYAAFLGIAPLFWGAISDAYGRKPVYIISLIILIVFGIISTFSTNVGMLIVFRAIQGCGGGAGQTLGAGVIADIYEASSRGKAYGIFHIGPLFGPIIGPTIGGALCEFLGWRSTLYFLAIIGAILLAMITFLLPETLRLKRPTIPIIVATEERNNEEIVVIHGKKTGQRGQSQVITKMKSVFSPMLGMLRDPTVVTITFYNTIIFAGMFFINPTIPDVFQTIYHYNFWQVGLCYILVGSGLIAGSLVSGRYSDYTLEKLRKTKGQDNLYPEMRLGAGFPSFVLIPTGLLIYGWSTQYAVGVYAPFIGLFVFAFGQLFGITPTSVYLVDSKPGRSASALAIHNFMRYIVSAIVAIFSTSCVRALGPGILFTILAGINVVNISLVILVIAYGRKWRTNFEKKRLGTFTAGLVKKSAS